MSLLIKIMQSLSADGFFITCRRALFWPVYKYRNYCFRRLTSAPISNEEKFTWIYKTNYWNIKESTSGAGSSLEYTANLRKELPILFNKFKINSVFDAPCGDFNWMSHVLKSFDLNYIGGDIVQPLIEKLNIKYSSEYCNFQHFDLVSEIPPKTDLMICRDCIFHLSYHDARLVFENFVKSGTPYLLTTTHINTGGLFANTDIATGDFRRIDLFSPPFNFPIDHLYEIEDWLAPEPMRTMCLWTRDQVQDALLASNSSGSLYHLLGTK